MSSDGDSSAPAWLGEPGLLRAGWVHHHDLTTAVRSLLGLGVPRERLWVRLAPPRIEREPGDLQSSPVEGVELLEAAPGGWRVVIRVRAPSAITSALLPLAGEAFRLGDALTALGTRAERSGSYQSILRSQRLKEEDARALLDEFGAPAPYGPNGSAPESAVRQLCGEVLRTGESIAALGLVRAMAEGDWLESLASPIEEESAAAVLHAMGGDEVERHAGGALAMIEWLIRRRRGEDVVDSFAVAVQSVMGVGPSFREVRVPAPWQDREWQPTRLGGEHRCLGRDVLLGRRAPMPGAVRAYELCVPETLWQRRSLLVDRVRAVARALLPVDLVALVCLRCADGAMVGGSRLGAGPRLCNALDFVDLAKPVVAPA